MPAIRGSESKTKTRRRTRDLDQVYEDLHTPKHLAQYKATKLPEDLPALGDFYCVECAKWFEAEFNLAQHKKAKPHKRRVRQLKEEPYTQKLAEAAVGLTTDNGRPEKMAIDEQLAEQANVEESKPRKDDDDKDELDAFMSVY